MPPGLMPGQLRSKDAPQQDCTAARMHMTPGLTPGLLCGISPGQSCSSYRQCSSQSFTHKDGKMNLFNTRHVLAALSAAVLSVTLLNPAALASGLSRKAQDNLFYGVASEPIGLDPALVDDNDSSNVNSNIYETLLKYKNDSIDLEPGLAQSWTISDDGLTYTFKLRKGVKFHDGTDFNARAVKYNFDRQMPGRRTANMPYAPVMFGDVKSITAVDDYTLEIVLNRRSTPFLRNMALCISAPIISPAALEKYGNNVSEHPVGTGPYKFVAWDRGQQLILTANENYWGAKPHVRNVIYKIIKDPSARVVALNNGEVDIINGIDAHVIEQIKKSGSQIYKGEGINTSYIAFNNRDGFVTADKTVRLAIAQAINVPEMINTLYEDYASPAHSYIPPGLAGYDPAVKAPEFNPEAAAKALKEKGITRLRAITSSSARATNPLGGQVLAEAVQAYLKKAGVELTIDVYDWAGFKSRLLTESWDLAFVGWMGNGDPDQFIKNLASKQPVANNGLWHNKEFEKIVQNATWVPDGPERSRLYSRADAILMEDVGILPLFHSSILLASRPGIGGTLINPLCVFLFAETTKK